MGTGQFLYGSGNNVYAFASSDTWDLRAGPIESMWTSVWLAAAVSHLRRGHSPSHRRTHQQCTEHARDPFTPDSTLLPHVGELAPADRWGGGGCQDTFVKAVGANCQTSLTPKVMQSDEEESEAEPGLRFGWSDDRRGWMEGIH